MVTDMLNNALIVSVDLLHYPGFVAQLRNEEIPGAEESFQVLKFGGMAWDVSTFHFRKFNIAGSNYETILPANDDWWTLLYNLGSLRKRAGAE